MESPSVKTTEMGGPERGEDGGKKSTGRKRPLLVATLGVGLAVLMTSAGRADGVAAPLLRGQVHPSHVPRPVTIFADQQEPNHTLEAWLAAQRVTV
jgi:hypothetical protein